MKGFVSLLFFARASVAIALVPVRSHSSGAYCTSTNSTTIFVTDTSLTNLTGPRVSLKNGTVEGYHIPSYNQDAFLGIPFAEAPTGELRFRTPQALKHAWNSTFEAKSYPPKCVGYGSEQIGNFAVAEDCLHLNVVRPACAGQGLPVAVWIHGGGFSQGGTVDTLYNMSYIIDNGVEVGKPFIGVSVQYRLNAWGFVNSEEVRNAGATNLGIRDQRLALLWIKENIAAFGGDSSRITIFGESAGAASVGIHLTAYGGRDDGLFSAAIMESGAPLLLGSKYNASTEQAKYDKIITATGCSSSSDSLQCLRELDYATLNRALNSTASGSFFPYVDGDLIRSSLYDQLEAGEFVKVPIITGTNTDEGVFTALGVNINTDDQFRTQAGAYGSNSTVDKLEVLYPNIPGVGIPELWTTPPPGRGSQAKRWAALSGDYTFIAPRRLTCQRWTEHGVQAWCYRFNGDTPLLPISGATHWVEVPYVFYNLERMGFAGGASAVPDKYRRTAKLVSAMWASFFSEHDPNGHGQADTASWPVYNDGVGGYAEDFVFEVNKTSGPERDTWRAQGIAYLNSVFGSEYGK
ncbi:Alpha/Beta hydrolase protein [Pyrenochaeta sp. MPI-SDFR-AT-0127]|nr:Alpha/Beta hydrolase protein [Pyrenochaeta sp. MPI-SDFR-AT-0127]